MKRAIKIFSGIIILLLLLFVVFTKRINHKPYFECEYYNRSIELTDSIKQEFSIEEGELQAGFSKVSITPLLNSNEDVISEDKFMQIPLAGYGGRKGMPASGIHDSIFIKTAALQSGDKPVFLISADLLIIPPEVTDLALSFLKNHNISRNQLFFSATHTHSSIGAWSSGYAGRQFAGKENENVIEWLAIKITEAVKLAKNDIRPARITAGIFNAPEFTRNRLVGERGTKNDDFSYIFIEQTGYRNAVIGSYSAHPTNLGSSNMEISAEYPGYWSRKMENSTVDLAIFFAGSVGSQSPVGKGSGFEKARYIGEALADSLKNRLLKDTLHSTTEFAHVSVKMPLPDINFRLTTKQNLATFISKKIIPFKDNAYVQALRLGNMIWITTPADFSGEYAMDIKHNLTAKGFNAGITSFNGAYAGYIIPGKYFYMDKYEPKTMGWFGPNMGDYTIDLIYRLTDIITN